MNTAETICWSLFAGLYFMCMSVLSGSTHHICAWYPQRSEEGIESPGTVPGSFEWPCGCWDLNLGPLEGQPLNSATEPSLQPCPLQLLCKDHNNFSIPCLGEFMI